MFEMITEKGEVPYTTFKKMKINLFKKSIT